MKFIAYPLLTLLGVLATVSIWVNLFHMQPALEATSLSLTEWVYLAILWMIGGGLFSWALSRDIAIWSTDTDIMDESDKDHPLVLKVNALVKEIGLPVNPLVGVYRSPETNIFTSGPFPKRSVLSVSQGFLKLSDEEQNLLIYSELQKIKNLDTALLVFCHGMTHGFVLYISRLLAFLLGTSFRQTEGSSSSTYPEIIVNVITTFFLTLFGSVVVFALSRARHRRGDQAVLARYGKAGLETMLQTLSRTAASLEHYDLFTIALKANHKARFWESPMPSHPSMKNRLRSAA